MLTDLLQRFDAFAGLSAAELADAARHAQTIDVPAKRWLWRQGRRLGGAYYLAAGRVRTFAPSRDIGHRSAQAKASLYPGHEAARTLSAVRLLHVDTASIAALLGRTEPSAEEEGLEPWERRFLGSPLMRRLDASVWQQLFSELDERPFASGDELVSKGAPARDFFVLKSGCAAVRNEGETLAQLGPGDFFGEDALILGAQRNATVVAVESGSVLRLPKDRFVTLLVNRVVRFVRSADAGVDIDLGAADALVGLRRRLKGLDPKERYRVVGGRPEERALAAFILAQKGFDAWAIDGPAL